MADKIILKFFVILKAIGDLYVHTRSQLVSTDASQSTSVLCKRAQYRLNEQHG